MTGPGKDSASSAANVKQPVWVKRNHPCDGLSEGSIEQGDRNISMGACCFRISLDIGRNALDRVCEARPNWQIIAGLARRIIQGGPQGPAKTEFSGWEYGGAEEIMDEIAALTPIYNGVSHARLADGECLQWPVEASGKPGTPILKAGAFSGGIVRWMPAQPVSLAAVARHLPENTSF